MRFFLGLLALAFTLVAGAPAEAQGRSEIFRVGGVRVDAQAASGAQARTDGLAQGQRLAFERLVRRLTAPEELTRIGMPKPEDAVLNRMVASTDIEQEGRPSTARYVARLAIAFDPTQVRNLLRQQGFTVLETRGAPILIVAQGQGVAPGLQELWRQAWEQGGFGAELQPLSVAPAGLVGPVDWSTAQPSAAAAGAATAVFATVRVTGSAVVADLVETSASAPPRSRGSVQAPLSIGAAGMAPSFQRLAEQVSARLQADWKDKLAAGAGATQTVAATALYRDINEWIRIRKALNQAAQTLVRGVRIDTVAKEGATLALTYRGTPEQLAAELGRGGVNATFDGQMIVLRASGG